MLDAYIIDRIRKERERTNQRSSQVPLYIENPEPSPDAPPERRQREPENPERGTVVIDFMLRA